MSKAVRYYYVVCNSESLSYKRYWAEGEYNTYRMLLQKMHEIQTVHKLTDADIENLKRRTEQYILRVCRSLYYAPHRKKRSLRIVFFKQQFSNMEFGRIVRKRNGILVDIVFCICCLFHLWSMADLFYNSWIKFYKN